MKIFRSSFDWWYIFHTFQGCSQYFPISFTPTFKSGPFRVTQLKIIQQTDNYIERDLTVEKLGEYGPDGKRESRHIRHLQFHTWPNYGVPEAVKPISEFIAHVYNRMKGNTIIYLGKHINIYISYIYCFAMFYHASLKFYRIWKRRHQ